MKIQLPKGTVLIDDDDFARLGGRSVYIGTNGYAYYSTWADGPTTVHSFVMGGARKGFHIDHLNGDKLDDRKSNLRFVTPSQNQVNRRRLNKNNTSGERGVAWCKYSAINPWKAQIAVSGRVIHLGLFPTKEAAVAARRHAEMEHYGEECPHD